MESNFSTIDWLIVGSYLGATVALGLLANRYVGSVSDFLVAGRSLRTRLGIATMIGSELGLVTAMYSAQKGFTGGFAAFHIGLLGGIGCLIVGLTGWIVVPLRRMGVMTIPEFYERRFGSRPLRIFGGLLLAASGILNMGLFLKAGAVFVTHLTGLTDPALLKLVMTAMIVLVLAYTALGGMVSVVLTDYLQFVVLSFGLLLACAISVGNLGWSRIVATVDEVHGTAGFNPLDADIYGPSYVAWMLMLGVVACGVWQTAVMRALSAESVQVVRSLYAWSSIGFIVRSLIPQFLGICALTYLWHHPELRSTYFGADGAIVGDNSLQAMPVFLSRILPAGMIGLIGAGMLAAFMSTHDTYLLCWASVLTEDVINPLAGERLSEPTRILLTRVLLVVIAGFLLFWSLWYPLGQDLWDYMAVSGAIYFIGAIVVLGVGIYWRRASTTGAALALTTGTLAVAGLTGVKQKLGLPDALRSEHIGLSVTALALALMVAGSLAFPDKQPPEPQPPVERNPFA